LVTIRDSKVVQIQKNEKARLLTKVGGETDDPSPFPRKLIRISLLSQPPILCGLSRTPLNLGLLTLEAAAQFRYQNPEAV
jgi:hypothetical protein